MRSRLSENLYQNVKCTVYIVCIGRDKKSASGLNGHNPHEDITHNTHACTNNLRLASLGCIVRTRDEYYQNILDDILKELKQFKNILN